MPFIFEFEALLLEVFVVIITYLLEFNFETVSLTGSIMDSPTTHNSRNYNVVVDVNESISRFWNSYS